MAARVQHPAPSFKATAVVDGEFQDVSLEDYRGKYLVLFFYPLDFTFVCPTEILAFSDRLAEFQTLNTEVLACSVDSKYSHLAWLNTPRADGGIEGVLFPIMADITKSIATDYGVLIESDGVALRGLFVIDPAGVLRISVVHDLPIGRSVDETIRVIKALQFHDTYGEVCPADWEPGGDTIRPEPDASKRYFQKANPRD